MAIVQWGRFRKSIVLNDIRFFSWKHPFLDHKVLFSKPKTTKEKKIISLISHDN